MIRFAPTPEPEKKKPVAPADQATSAVKAETGSTAAKPAAKAKKKSPERDDAADGQAVDEPKLPL